MALTFEWDPKKARTNLAKHRVGFEEASTIFGDGFSVTIPDPLHSETGKSVRYDRQFASRQIDRCRSYRTRQQYPDHQRTTRKQARKTQL